MYFEIKNILKNKNYYISQFKHRIFFLKYSPVQYWQSRYKLNKYI